jgi:hypothetical protein
MEKLKVYKLNVTVSRDLNDRIHYGKKFISDLLGVHTEKDLERIARRLDIPVIELKREIKSLYGLLNVLDQAESKRIEDTTVNYYVLHEGLSWTAAQRKYRRLICDEASAKLPEGTNSGYIAEVKPFKSEDEMLENDFNSKKFMPKRKPSKK